MRNSFTIVHCAVRRGQHDGIGVCAVEGRRYVDVRGQSVGAWVEWPFARVVSFDGRGFGERPPFLDELRGGAVAEVDVDVVGLIDVLDGASGACVGIAAYELPPYRPAVGVCVVDDFADVALGAAVVDSCALHVDGVGADGESTRSDCRVGDQGLTRPCERRCMVALSNIAVARKDQETLMNRQSSSKPLFGLTLVHTLASLGKYWSVHAAAASAVGISAATGTILQLPLRPPFAVELKLVASYTASTTDAFSL